MAGGDMSKRSAMAPADSSRSASISTMRWRVGSARAFRTNMAPILSIYLIKSMLKYGAHAHDTFSRMSVSHGGSSTMMSCPVVVVSNVCQVLSALHSA